MMAAVPLITRAPPPVLRAALPMKLHPLVVVMRKEKKKEEVVS